MTSPLINGKAKVPSSTTHRIGKHQRRHRKTEGVGLHKCTKQPSKRYGTEDIDKIIHFLKTEKGPQKTLTIAKACGYESKGKINPTLYHMEINKLIEKMQERPPLWNLSHAGMNYSNGAILSHRGQHNSYSPSKQPQVQHYNVNNHHHGSVHHYRPHREWNKGSRYPKQNRSSEGRLKNNTLNSSEDRSATRYESFSQGDLFAREAALDCNLFTKSANDTNAPGAYRAQQRLEHSNEKHMNTNKFGRTVLPFYSKKEPIIEHESASGHTDPHWSGSTGHFESTVSSANEFLTDRNTQNSMESEKPLLCGKNLDNSDYSDDEEYDLNFRISDVVSIRDPDFRADMQVLNSSDVKSEVEICEDGEGYDIKTQEMTDICGSEESNHEETWVDDGHFGATVIPKMGIYEKAAEAIQKVIDSNLLKVLNALPLQSTTKTALISELNMAVGDLEQLLDICLKEGWIDFSAFAVRLTEAGVKFLECQQLGKGTVLQRSNSRPLFPDEVLKSSSAIDNIHALSEKHQDVLSISDISNNPQNFTCASQVIQSQNNNPFDRRVSKQMKLTQEINSKGKMLMPWLLSKAPLVSNKHLTSVRELGEEPSLSVPPSISGGILSSPRKPSYEQPFFGANKVNLQIVENYTSTDFSNLGILSSGFPSFSSLQEPVQQKRPPLLTTPDVRGFSNFLRSSSTFGKIPLLPYPGQPTQNLNHQSQVQQQDMPTNLQISTESFAALNKNPISAFMEYGQCRHTPARIEVLSQRGPPHKPVFTIAAVLGTRVFPGITSSNKKDGKKDAAEQAIRILIAEGQYNMPVNSNVISIPESSMTQFDKIAALTHHKFNQLIATIPESLVGRKVIAGLILKMNDEDTGTVVALGSGNRCITGDKLSLRGLTVNDSHAEIITRRGFMRFLYYQLKSYDPSKDHPLFEKSSTGKLRIKYTITFHLYISTAPCGDGALFSPRDVESNNATLTDSCTTHRPTFETNVQGVLRTKMEGGEGTIPVDLEKPVQTWDGIVRGERLRTMSCSDKICRWNVLGLQGALLANILDPIYLSSITLGFLFDAGHLSRAVCCRLNRGDPLLDSCLPFPYHLNHPVLGRVTACDATRETQKTKSYSINWMVEDDKPEIIDGCQGACYTGDKNEPPQSSRLCKKNMFDHFRQTCQVLKHREFLNASLYSVAKTMSPEFRQAKTAMIQKFKTTNCGVWLGKPVEEEMFA